MARETQNPERGDIGVGVALEMRPVTEMALGQYELIVLKALERLSDGPWTVPDIGRAEQIIDDEMCGAYGPGCDSSAVVDWLRALSDHDRSELVARANDEWSSRQGTGT
jgi:hypothetical protein